MPNVTVNKQAKIRNSNRKLVSSAILIQKLRGIEVLSSLMIPPFIYKFNNNNIKKIMEARLHQKK